MLGSTGFPLRLSTVYRGRSGKTGCRHRPSSRSCSLIACLNQSAKLSCLAQLLFCVFETLTLEKSPYYRLPHGSELSQPI
jgi:hypothetical protein